MRTTLLGISLLFLALPFVTADHAQPHVRKHHEIAKRANGDLERRQSFSNSRFTFYEVGLGACGATNVASDFIVALNTPQYGSGYPGPNCWKYITITVGDKSTVAQITDECPGCPYAGLDMSEGLFQYFSDLGTGVLYGTWSFNDGSGGGGGGDPTTSSWVPPPTSSTPPPWTPSTTDWVPSSTWSPDPEPSTTWSPSSTWEPPSSTWEPPSSSWVPLSSSWVPSSSSWVPSSSAWSSPAWSSSSAWSSPASSSSSSAPPAASTPAGDTIETLNQVVIGLAGLVVAAARH